MKKMFKRTKINKNFFCRKIKMITFLIGKNNATKSSEVKMRVKSLLSVLIVVLAHQKLRKNHKFKVKFLHWKNKRNQRSNYGRELSKNVRNVEMNLPYWLRTKMSKKKRTLKLTYKMIDSKQFMRTLFSQSILPTLNSIIEEQEMFSNKW